MKLPEAIVPVMAALTDTHGDHENRPLILDLFKQFFKLCRKYGLTKAIHLGDFFIDRKGQGLITLYLFIEVGNLARKYGVTLYIIPGNHDKTDQTSHLSYLGIYNHPNILVMDACDPEQSYIDDIPSNIRYWFLPYFTEEVYDQKLKVMAAGANRNFDMRNVLVTHVGLDGILNNRGEVEERTIPVGKFAMFDLTWIGHYHNFNIVSKRVRYIASTHQTNYGEDAKKGFTLLTAALKSVHVPSVAPTWLKLRITDSSYDNVARLIGTHHGNYDHLKFEFCCTEEEYFKVNKEELLANGIEVAWIPTNGQTLTDQEADQLATTSAFTPKEVNKNFLHYCQDQKITPDRRRLGLQLIKNAFQS